MNPRQKLLAALFSKAHEYGIDAEALRNEVAPAIIKKRLSAATPGEIVRLIEHVAGLSGKRRLYESSREGLIEELEDAAKARWGEDFQKALNAFINSHYKRAVRHYRFLNVASLKKFRDRIKELNEGMDSRT